MNTSAGPQAPIPSSDVSSVRKEDGPAGNRTRMIGVEEQGKLFFRVS